MGICGVPLAGGGECQKDTVWNDLCDEHLQEYEDEMYGQPSKKDKIKKIAATLEDSNIVWPKYGDDTIESLAERILSKLEE